MRINRTFSIPIELVHELKKKHNQSETVTRALRKYLEPYQELTVENATSRQLMASLTNRADIDDTLKTLLLQILTK
jgi:ribosomal protein S4